MTPDPDPTFPTPTLDDWRTEAERVLRGKPLSSVTWTTEDGIEVPPVVPEPGSPAPPCPTREGALRVCVTADTEEEIARYQRDGFDLVRVVYEHDDDEQDGGFEGLDLSRVLLDPVAASSAVAALEDLPEAHGIVLGQEWLWPVEGATLGQQAGFLLSAAVDVLSEVDASCAARLYLEVPVGPEVLSEVARLRAVRMAWQSIATERDLPPTLRLLASVPSFPHTRYDAESNLLRATLAGFAAIAGGADAVEFWPYRLDEEEAEGARLALNQMRLMLEESWLGEVADPFAGSGAIEHLTERIASVARTEFGRLRKLGGYLHIRTSQDYERQSELYEPYGAAQERRIDALATRRRTVVGVNRFADPSRDADVVQLDAPELMFGNWSEPGSSLREASHRADGVHEFEFLRDRTTWHVAAGGARPTVTLLPLGPVRWRRARADFAADFFRAAGFSIDDPGGFESVADAVAHVRSTGAQIAVACSDDTSYPELVPALVESLADTPVYVAGRPPADEPAGGVTAWIYEGADALVILCAAQDSLGMGRLP